MSTEFIWKLWNNQYGLDQDNFYANLLRSSKSLLDFEVPRGLRCSFTSLPTANFANSHRLTVFPTIGGSLSFLHTSRPFTGFQRTKTVPLTEFVEGYRMIREYTPPGEDCDREVWQGGKRVDAKDTLMFGRLHLPYKKLEAIYARRLSATRQLILSCTSDPTLLNGGAAFAQLQQDMGKYSVEYVYHTDDALIGCRTLWNFGPDPRTAGLDDLIEQDNLVSPNAEGLAEARDLPLSAYGKFSAGAEIYYGALYKSGGVSAGLRFSTLPSYHGHPTTMTLTVNPLVGHVSASHAIKAGNTLSLCSRMDFNIFSYESDLTVGCELWQYSQRETTQRVGPFGVLKASVHSSTLNGALVWEGRIRDLILTIGANFDLRNKERPMRTFGMEIQYGTA